jgi:hypothetical protein
MNGVSMGEPAPWVRTTVARLLVGPSISMAGILVVRGQLDDRALVDQMYSGGLVDEREKRVVRIHQILNSGCRFDKNLTSERRAVL